MPSGAKRRGWTSVVAVATLAALLVAAAPAAAVITPTRDAGALAAALGRDGARVTGATFGALPPAGAPAAVSTTPLASFPTQGGSYAILSTGDATLAATPNTAPNSGVDAPI